MWIDDAGPSAEGTGRVCEARRTENWRSHKRRTRSCEATAARRTCDEVNASVETEYLDGCEIKERFERRKGGDSSVSEEEGPAGSLYDDHDPSTAIIIVYH